MAKTVRGRTSRCRSRLRRASVLTTLVVALIGSGAVVSISSEAGGPQAGADTVGGRGPALVGNPAGLVDPLDGTGTGPVDPGTVGEFPGADLPFGMLQWSPDTTPDRAASGGGYSYADSAVNGFSLTHLSGTGCASYGDVPVLPTVGPVGSSPASATDSFSHATEHAAPGRYGVTLGSAGQSVTTRLAVTTRTGLARFTFPATGAANLLFKVAGSTNPVSASAVHLDGHDGISGQVTSGQFCGTGTDYTLYFSARFDRPFASAGSWNGPTVSPGTTTCAGAACGAFVTFDTGTDRSVEMKVGISFVSVQDAAANLAAEDPGWSLDQVESRATAQWNALLGRVAIGGGTPAQQHTFETALYHSLLEPDVVSDVNGAYAGEDGRVHQDSGRAHYANFSEWDIYRSQIPLVALVARHRAGDMVQSLVDAAAQVGWLPKWAIVGGDESQMNGDSADPIIAAAYAFGVRNFDARAALNAMVKGATLTETGHGFEIERQYLSQYLAQHYVDAGSLDLTSIDYSIGGSVTLEYALDDFAIARLASALGDGAVASTMMERAHNWEYLFDPSTGYLGARNADGSFPAGPAFQTSQLEPGGQLGFEEGNAVQYTWSVPEDLAALSDLMGGDAAATAALDATFAQLNAGRDQPYDWAGNEPSEWTPWEYVYLGAPWRAEQVVRTIADTLYADAPVDEPGNDDLGALSSWYVWAAIGLYPVTPGTSDLALASPLFPEVVVTLPDGRHLTERAPAASASTPYVHALTVTGVAAPPRSNVCGASVAGAGSPPGASNWDRPWLPGSVLRSGGDLSFTLASTPDQSWGSAVADAPPSYGAGRLPAVGSTLPGGATSLRVGRPTTLQLRVTPAAPGPLRVRWTAAAKGTGLSISPDHGLFRLGGAVAGSSGHGPARCSLAVPATEDLTVVAHAPGSYVLDITLATSGGVALPPVVVDVEVTG